MVSVSYTNGTLIPSGYCEIMNLFDNNNLFVPPSDFKKFVEGKSKKFREGYYRFNFNYFLEGEGRYRLVPNQPLLVIEPTDEEDPNTPLVFDYLFR